MTDLTDPDAPEPTSELMRIHLRGGQTIELPITDWKLSKPANDLTYLDWKTATPGRKVPFLRLDDVSAVEILPLPATPAEAGTSG